MSIRPIHEWDALDDWAGPSWVKSGFVTDHDELPWRELKSQLLHFPHDTDLKKLFCKTIHNKKRAAWAKFQHEQGHPHPWEIIRIAKDPFRHSQHMGELTEEHNRKSVYDLEKVASF